MTASGDELHAAVQARKELGREYEDALVESFLEKIDREIDRRVDERLAKQGPAYVQRSSNGSGQRFALAIISVVLGVLGTVGALAAEADLGVLVIWIGIGVVNLVFALGERERPSSGIRPDAPPAPEPRHR
ncbi:hypothetical protein ABZ860_36110 [Microbispora sp. NPDC046973]|uniref:hypothetical protein n=1 Tax=Microbispora sp. NPDC046973 TaxID=3155022 RepID=UPI0033ECCCAC